MDEELYYLQHGVLGNDMMFWRKGSRGYTTNVDEAEVFTKEQAFHQNKVRANDIPRKKSVIDSMTHPSVSVNRFYKETSNV